jgi:ferrochelatase
VISNNFGILLTNTGTPDAPTTRAVRSYLREFLSDKRVVQLPRLIWLPILYGFVLTLRPSKSAKLYENIWTPQGSPMRVAMQSLRERLHAKLSVPVEIGMNYGNPSIKSGISLLQNQGVDKIIVLPLFPQYSHTSTASSLDRVLAPHAICNKSYADHPDYIAALAASVRESWKTHGKSPHLLISFHGIPERFIKQGDPYQSECEITATLLAKSLQLSPSQWTLCYQSQFGYDKWLKPSTFDLLKTLPERGLRQVDVICPGFAVDCLETLEEIAIRGQEIFHQGGGKTLRYIPALNDTSAQVDLLATLALSKL